MQFSRLAEAIELPDSSGLKRLRFVARGASGDHFVADVQLTVESFDAPNGAEVLLRGLPISRARFQDLSRALASWLAHTTPIEASLVEDRWADFNLVVGPDASMISSNGKPACSITMRWCGVSASLRFVVDQSCLRLFHEGVDGWLRLRSDRPSPD